MANDALIYIEKDRRGTLRRATVRASNGTEVELPVTGAEMRVDPQSTGAFILKFHALRVRVLEVDPEGLS